MKALFGRKFYNLKELREATEEAKEDGVIGSDYTVIREVELSDLEFKKFTSDFLEDQPWIRKSDGGTNEKGELRCIRVVNKDTGEKILTNPEGYEKHNPVNFVKNWKTPMLVIHGAYDFRVVDTQGIGTFNALQRLGIPSKLLYFPDESHWVLKPHNSIQWHETVIGWLDRWCKK